MRNTISGSPLRAFMKMVVDAPTDKVLGIHMIGDSAAEVMQVWGEGGNTGRLEGLCFRGEESVGVRLQGRQPPVRVCKMVVDAPTDNA